MFAELGTGLSVKPVPITTVKKGAVFGTG